MYVRAQVLMTSLRTQKTGLLTSPSQGTVWFADGLSPIPKLNEILARYVEKRDIRGESPTLSYKQCSCARCFWTLIGKTFRS